MLFLKFSWLKEGHVKFRLFVVLLVKNALIEPLLKVLEVCLLLLIG